MTKTEYRTAEQYKEISETMVNGNLRDAVNLAIEYGFYATDLIWHYEQNEFNIMDLKDIAMISEWKAEQNGEKITN